MARTRSVLTASAALVKVCGASPSTCAYHPFFTMFQSACGSQSSKRLASLLDAELSTAYPVLAL